jgi:hypothetical protein
VPIIATAWKDIFHFDAGLLLSVNVMTLLPTDWFEARHLLFFGMPSPRPSHCSTAH